MRVLLILLLFVSISFAQYDADYERFEFVFQPINLPEDQIDFDQVLTSGDTVDISFKYYNGEVLNNNAWLPTIAGQDTTIFVQNTPALWNADTANVGFEVRLPAGFYQVRAASVVYLNLVGEKYTQRTSDFTNRLDYKFGNPLQDVAKIYFIWK
jgi:hypothetical protein